jgi:hypothetical protein
MRLPREPATSSIVTSADGLSTPIDAVAPRTIAGCRLAPRKDRRRYWARLLGAALAVMTLVIAGCVTCAAADDLGRDAPCTISIRPNGASGAIQAAVDSAGPGSVICVAAGAYPERVRINRGGTPQQPLTLRAAPDVFTHGFIVKADDVAIRGFAVTNPPGVDDGRGFGIYLAGQRLHVVSNIVRYPAQDGIGCEQKAPNCPGATIRDNIVIGAEGAGIVTYGNGVLIEGNDVSGSTSHHAVDADGIRFYGAGVVLRANKVHDITQDGYPPGEAPHTDCFQTFPKAGFAVSDVLLEGNSCVNVDDQCLIADGPPGPTNAPPITFRNNLCANRGSQALLIRRLPGIVVTGNTFGPEVVYWGINLLFQSTGAEIISNTFSSAHAGRFHPVKVDHSSQLGLRYDGPIYVGD